MNAMAGGDGGPYVGRRAFTLDDQQLFFGRDREINELRDQWQHNGLVVLHGPTASGKTSLLQAGVIPQLRMENVAVLPVGRAQAASPFPEPLLAEHNPHALAVLTSWSPAEPSNLLAQESITGFLHRRWRALQWSQGTLPLMVAIDQLEEVLDANRADHERDGFFADLGTAIHEIPQLRVLLSTRTESLGPLSRYAKDLGLASAPRFALPTLSPEAAVRAIRRPAQNFGVQLSDGAAEYLVRELAAEDPDRRADDETTETKATIEPVQLQVICTGLWEKVAGSYQPITLSLVQNEFKIVRALARFCGDVIEEVAAQQDVPSAWIFQWLRQRAIRQDNTVRQQDRERRLTTSVSPAVLAALEDKHILTSFRNSGRKHYRLMNHHVGAAIRYLDTFWESSNHERIDASTWLRIAEAALANGNYSLAERHAEEALGSADPGDLRLRADAQSLLGNIAFRSGRQEQAEKRYRLAAELRDQVGDRPAVGRLYGALGRMHAHRGRYVAALEELQAAVTRLPDDLTIQTELATTLWRSGQPHAAAAVFGAVLTVEPESVEALAGRGQISAERGNAAAAMDDLKTLRRLRPSSSLRPEVRSAYALALALDGRPDLAMAEANAAIAAADDNGVILLRAARVARASGALDRAVALLHKAEAAGNPALSSDQRSQARRLLGEFASAGTSESS